METFAEAEIIDYRLFFADQEKKTWFSVCGKQTKVCHFCFPFAANNWKLPFFFCRIPETCRHGGMEKWRHGDMDMEF
jgi:hypothetical protein